MTRIKEKVLSPTPDAEKMARHGFRNGFPLTTIQRDIKKRLGENIVPKRLRDMQMEWEATLETRKHFKRKGGELVNGFLEKAKGGEDVSELQSVLSHAVYLDLLRRYAEADDGLEELPMKEWLKLTGDFQKIRLASLKAGVKAHRGLTAPQALELIDVIVAEFQVSGEPTRLSERMREKLHARVAELYETREFTAATDDHELMQHIMENYERHQQSAGGDS